jgi:hypothetical protein
MIKQIFSVKSPVWQMISISMLYAGLLLILANDQNPDTRGMTPERIELLIIVGLIIVFLIAYAAALRRYNKRTSHDHIDLMSIDPAELHDEDEGMSMFTAKATRRVYRYYSYMVPLAMIFFAVSAASLVTIITLLFAVIMGHYIVYWHTVWPALSEPTEE